MTKDLLVQNARTWIGTKYLFGQCVKGSGADCATFIIGVFMETGIFPKTFRMSRRYNRQATANLPESVFINELEKVPFFQRVWDSETGPQPPPIEKGDVLVFKKATTGDGHMGLCTDTGLFIHCNTTGGVQEERFLKQTVSSVWRCKEWVG